MGDERFWRIRIKYPNEDLTKIAWKKGVVGIWYGAWTASDFEKLLNLARGEVADALTECNKRAGLAWKITPAFIDTAKRFWTISEHDWVFSCFDDSVHIAKVEGVEIRPHKEFARGGEQFKFRKLKLAKSFVLNELPDCFRLLASAGRGNVHQVGATRALVRLLADNNSEADVCAHFRQLSWEEWLNALGPHGWESLCLGYLVMEHDFVPTSLDVGRTLPFFDLIGRTRSGQRIYAQCKKNPFPVTVGDDFTATLKPLVNTSLTFVFAYGGCMNCRPVCS